MQSNTHILYNRLYYTYIQYSYAIVYLRREADGLLHLGEVLHATTTTTTTTTTTNDNNNNNSDM